MRILLVPVLGILYFVSQAQQAMPVNPDLLTKQWTASWIADPASGTKSYGVYHFRRSFNLPAKPKKFIVHVTADNRYRLFVNGKAVGLGPARGDKMHWQYETYDLASFLQAGKNSIAAMVWNMADMAPVAQMSLGTGFLMQGNSANEDMVNTGTQPWKVMRNAAFRPYAVTAAMVNYGYYAVGACDSIYGAVFPWGWENTQFNDDAWRNPKIVRLAKPAYYRFGHGEGDGNLVPRNIPMMEERQERLSQVVRSSGVKPSPDFLQGRRPVIIPANSRVTILLDHAKLTTAYPELVVSGGKGSSIDISYAEALLDLQRNKGNRNETENKILTGYHDAFITDGGQQRLFRPLWFRTFRYLQLDIKTSGQALTINDLYGMFTAYPFEEKAFFTSGNDTLSRIWNVAWRTARLCANETYFDCPYYEQLQYVGDTRIQALVSLHVSGDDRLVRNALTLYDYSRLPEGITQSRYPTDYPQMIPPFALYWINMVHDYHMYRNDPEFVKGFLPGIRSVLSWFESHLNKNHLLADLGWWNFLDWSAEYNRGVPPGAEDKEGTAVISLHFTDALEDAAKLFTYYGKEHEAAAYKQLADSIRRAVAKTCYDEKRKLFANTPAKQQFSQHVNIMAILTDAIPEQDQQELMRKILDDHSLVQATIYYKFYLMRALHKTGLGNEYLSHLDSWKNMLAQGLTTFAEKEDDTRSDCHAWSASPMIGFLQVVCGMEPSTPGFTAVRIQPNMNDLSEVEGGMPHPLGMIRVKLVRKGSHGMHAEISLPEGLKGTFVWNGETINMVPGFQAIDR